MSCWQALERSFQRVCRQVSTRPSPMGMREQNFSASFTHAESARAVDEAVASTAAKSAISGERGLVLDMVFLHRVSRVDLEELCDEKQVTNQLSTTPNHQGVRATSLSMKPCSIRYQLARAPSRARTDISPNRIRKMNSSSPGRRSFSRLRLFSSRVPSGNASPGSIERISSRSMTP